MKKTPETTAENTEGNIAVGILAHVDAGKTTLAEGLLFAAGKLRKMGRVDHKDAFLDTYSLEKQRGITIFSKQARLTVGSRNITLLDTPGHVDFSPEMERTLMVLDYAILVISAADGIQGHVLTLWRLLKHYSIPVFIFVNKMDQVGCEKAALLSQLKETFSDSCIDFTQQNDEFYEEAATCSEEALEEYLETGRTGDALIRKAIAARQIFPCFFGSALHLDGVNEFLKALDNYLLVPEYPDAFGARIFKISRDERGERLTYLKITGGSLKVKTLLSGPAYNSSEFYEYTSPDPPSGTLSDSGQWHEKVNQIRIYDGSKYELVDEAKAGSICAVTGLSLTHPADGLGIESGRPSMQLVPVLTYRILLPEGCDAHKCAMDLKQLEEEEPRLNMVWKEETGEIHVQVMGEVQLEILKSLIKERYGLDVEFGAGSIIYKETIRGTVEGVGHFEPLRHYAEVHLLLESGERGSGMVFAADCSEDLLDKNWQRLIMTHLMEKRHIGTLTGSELTDMKITLKSGRAHPKHTEGGDFRQATYRAVRQGLMQAESVLLEPYYAFRLEVPSEMTGRAMNDLQRMCGRFDPAQQSQNMTVFTGTAPVSAMREYPVEVASYTRGTGRISCEFSGYDICHNADEVILKTPYDAERDTENPSSSVFCTHGSGYIVPWDKVPEYMHLESVLKKAAPDVSAFKTAPQKAASSKAAYAGEKELKEIFERTYGSGTYARSNRELIYRPENKRKSNYSYEYDDAYDDGAEDIRKKSGHAAHEKTYSYTPPKEKYLFVDGYNIIFAWDELKSLAQASIDAARDRLTEILCNYQAYRGMTLILVFDGYRVKGNPGESYKYHTLDVVFTKEGENADQYIERTVSRIGKKYDVTVATSDNLEQLSIFSHGARRMSAAELYREIESMSAELRSKYLENTPKTNRRLFDELSEETIKKLEAIRLAAQEEKNEPE